MIGLEDVNEVRTRCREEIPALSAIPKWAEGRGVAREAVEILIALAASQVSEATGFDPADLDPERGPDSETVALIGALTQLFVTGFELGRLRLVPDSALPDLDNVQEPKRPNGSDG